MSPRTGKQYVEGLRDDRVVWLGNQKVEVTTHPAFAGSVAGMAGYFDWQNQHADECLVPDPQTGKPMSASLIVPRNAEDLRLRRAAFERFARYSEGMLGRGLRGVTSPFARATSSVARATHLAGVWALLPREVGKPLADAHDHPSCRRQDAADQGINGQVALRVVRRTRDSIIVRGAKILATLGPFADELFVYPGVPQPPGTDPGALLAFSIPMNSRGLITLCRDHYGVSAPVGDQPFSTRFDEQDAYMIFDDVESPRASSPTAMRHYNNLMRTGAANIAAD
jgi:4-hydroxyphenylacetate 3-monooxygenase/anthranilate 3-monooxygenase (FAD)/4-hydroxyphenylacetate 3-monooxygenase